LPIVDECKQHTMTELRFPDSTRRPPMVFSAGCDLDYVYLPRPDTSDPLTLAIGTQARSLRNLPDPDPVLLNEFEEFLNIFIPQNFTPLRDTDILPPEEWIDSRPYPLKEKMRLKRELMLWNRKFDKKFYQFKLFTKDEPYTDVKHARNICGPSDAAKVYFGPYITAMEEQLYAKTQFIKTIAVDQRPAYMKEAFGAFTAKFGVTDYSKFEAAFKRAIKDKIELKFHDYMTSGLSTGSEYRSRYREWVRNRILLVNKFFMLDIEEECARTSGENATSMNNGFTNWVIQEFYKWQTGIDFLTFVEGDDGLTMWAGTPPTKEWYARLGFDIKIELHSDLSTTSFCGQVFDDTDMKVFTDPRYVLAGFGWLPNRYSQSKRSVHLCLLRAKAWSYGYQYQACPIISSMSRCFLRLTRSYDARKAFEYLDSYKAAELKKALDAGRPVLNQPVGMNTRLLMEKLYGVSVAQQLQYEAWFDGLESLDIVSIPNFFTNIPESWTKMCLQYVTFTDRTPRYKDYPSELWPIAYPIQTQWGVRAALPQLQDYIDQRIIVVPRPLPLHPMVAVP